MDTLSASLPEELKELANETLALIDDKLANHRPWQNVLGAMVSCFLLLKLWTWIVSLKGQHTLVMLMCNDLD